MATRVRNCSFDTSLIVVYKKKCATLLKVHYGSVFGSTQIIIIIMIITITMLYLLQTILLIESHSIQMNWVIDTGIFCIREAIRYKVFQLV